MYLAKLKRLGSRTVQYLKGRHRFPLDFTAEEIEIIERVQPCTKTSRERLQALIQAVGYLHRNRIPGAIVECGVWKGGSMMAAALALDRLGCRDRDLYLFDTFEGMKDPTQFDVTYKGMSALAVRKTREQWSYCSLAEVQRAFAGIPYDPRRIHYVKGMVEDTVPQQAPDPIALLRLDTDWYESTKHELEHLYPRLSPGGVLIIDDYGHWLGARKATDEFFATPTHQPFFHRIDYTGRLIVKSAA